MENEALRVSIQKSEEDIKRLEQNSSILTSKIDILTTEHRHSKDAIDKISSKIEIVSDWIHASTVSQKTKSETMDSLIKTIKVIFFIAPIISLAVTYYLDYKFSEKMNVLYEKEKRHMYYENEKDHEKK